MPRDISLFCCAVFSSATGEDISAIAIVCHDKREILNIELLNRFTAKILKSDNFTGFYAIASQCSSAAYCAQVNCLVPDNGISYLLRSFALTDHSAKT